MAPYDNKHGGFQQQKRLPPEIRPQKVPDDYVDQAERIMRSLMGNKKAVTTSKIRGMLSMVSEIYNKENRSTKKELREETVIKLNLMRVRVAYEYGRDTGEKAGKDPVTGKSITIYPVQDFITQAKLLEYLKGISNDRADLIRFAHYMEALVAYHRYFGGREG